MTIDWVGAKYVLQAYIKLFLEEAQTEGPLTEAVRLGEGSVFGDTGFRIASSTVASCGQPTFFENLIKASKVVVPPLLPPPHPTPGHRPDCLPWLLRLFKSHGSSPLGARHQHNVLANLDVRGAVNSNPAAKSLTVGINLGTTPRYVPRDVAATIYCQVAGAQRADQMYGSGFWSYPCNAKLDIRSKYGSSFFTLQTMDFSLGNTGFGSS
ncbi:hypothetical protein FRC00_003468 [Tulasnella sp. 408]|nr:hypothetical protein FRC00_003468 [Tulasnella sp. 408]